MIHGAWRRRSSRSITLLLGAVVIADSPVDEPCESTPVAEPSDILSTARGHQVGHRRDGPDSRESDRSPSPVEFFHSSPYILPTSISEGDHRDRTAVIAPAPTHPQPTQVRCLTTRFMSMPRLRGSGRMFAYVQTICCVANSAQVIKRFQSVRAIRI